MKNGSYLFFSEKFIKWRMMNEEYELVLYAWDTPLRPQAEERNPNSSCFILHSSFNNRADAVLNGDV